MEKKRRAAIPRIHHVWPKRKLLQLLQPTQMDLDKEIPHGYGPDVKRYREPNNQRLHLPTAKRFSSTTFWEYGRMAGTAP